MGEPKSSPMAEKHPPAGSPIPLPSFVLLACEFQQFSFPPSRGKGSSSRVQAVPEKLLGLLPAAMPFAREHPYLPPNFSDPAQALCRRWEAEVSAFSTRLNSRPLKEPQLCLPEEKKNEGRVPPKEADAAAWKDSAKAVPAQQKAQDWSGFSSENQESSAMPHEDTSG